MLNYPIGTVNYLDIEVLWDVFISDVYQNRPLPKEMNQEIFKNLTFLDSHNWLLNNGGPKYLK